MINVLLFFFPLVGYIFLNLHLVLQWFKNKLVNSDPSIFFASRMRASILLNNGHEISYLPLYSFHALLCISVSENYYACLNKHPKFLKANKQIHWKIKNASNECLLAPHDRWWPQGNLAILEPYHELQINQNIKNVIVIFIISM